MKGIVFGLVGLLVLFFLLFGCPGTPVCGDNICQSNYENYSSCPQDCGGSYPVDFKVGSDYTTDVPISDAKIVISDGKSEEVLFTDLSGNAAVTLPAGKYSVVVSKIGYKDYFGNFILESPYTFGVVLEQFCSDASVNMTLDQNLVQNTEYTFYVEICNKAKEPIQGTMIFVDENNIASPDDFTLTRDLSLLVNECKVIYETFIPINSGAGIISSKFSSNGKECFDSQSIIVN